MAVIHYKTLGGDAFTLNNIEADDPISKLASAIKEAQNLNENFTEVELSFEGAVLADLDAKLPINAGATAASAIAFVVIHRF